MKTSLDHLPAHKQEALRAIADLLCAGAPVEMLILFGSHARGDWVEDPEQGYFSDYDLLATLVRRAHRGSGAAAGVALQRRWSSDKEGSMRRVVVVLAALLLSGCTPQKIATTKRAHIEEVGAAAVKFIPEENQPPYCLIFTVSEKGVMRQLTMNADNTSVACEAGKPVGGVVYRIPPAEGKVRVHILFSDRALEAGPMANQIHELAGQNPKFSALDLRAPGKVVTETLEFTPTVEAEGVTIWGDGTVTVGDAGSKPASAPSAAPSAQP